MGQIGLDYFTAHTHCNLKTVLRLFPCTGLLSFPVFHQFVALLNEHNKDSPCWIRRSAIEGRRCIVLPFYLQPPRCKLFVHSSIDVIGKLRHFRDCRLCSSGNVEGSMRTPKRRNCLDGLLPIGLVLFEGMLGGSARVTEYSSGCIELQRLLGRNDDSWSSPQACSWVQKKKLGSYHGFGWRRCWLASG